MQSSSPFLQRITELIEENIANEQFGVSELADAMNMSRSNLLRKVQKETSASVSQFIRQVRLNRAMEMLKTDVFTVSEISYKVGFSSTSYFIKCFREQYGYTPGEASQQDVNCAAAENSTIAQPKHNSRYRWIAISAGIILLALAAIFFFNNAKHSPYRPDKSIAVLPFVNNSSDSINVYIINGVMESVLGHLQKIEDLRVVSRTSVEKYRSTTKSIPEITEELNVGYIVEGSGQKVGDEIRLNIQLIDAAGDRHLWAEEYHRNLGDIFDLQVEVAKSIAQRIEVIITPEEEERIRKVPTNDMVAYDYFLKGINELNKDTKEGMFEAIKWLEKAVGQDKNFALAYATIAIAYYYLDAFQIQKKYLSQLNYYADQALLIDTHLGEALIAKSFYYLNIRDYERALPYLEKALEYNPNSALVFNHLSNYYAMYVPNTARYLEYALKGVQLDINSQDSLTASYTYLHISNALIQAGFINEAEHYINKSLIYNPKNIFSDYVKAYILYARDNDIARLKKRLLNTLARDTTRLDVLQEVAKVCYYNQDYELAYEYYSKFLAVKDSLKLDIYPAEYAKIAVVHDKLGMHKKADNYLQLFKDFVDNDKSIYKHISLASYYSYKGDMDRALEEFKRFVKEDDYFYWVLLFQDDPMIENMNGHPEFDRLCALLKEKFWERHERIKQVLREKRLLLPGEAG
ncbi:Putative serine/threonine kinase [Fulvivirga imtechensis AK7]|uniref:Putative serine/threonine kinase n=1 Tax=Fulvivirga imtechensis AK7 TaxID=1237149 RepID=L8JWA1_9BACT|nr:helix-turn-helix domain-containing protein [Fulvivirga imtechensis]ELR71507.1 Putative serine/threonine kinase [Fulvivirga imtechensis AK7]